jgi:tRNA-2-methylthio-N6-dimethylallyladenosine synthase
MKKFHIETFGCQMNQSDSSALHHLLVSTGHAATASVDEAEVVILNTCSVRQHAEDKVYSRIGALAKRYGAAKRVVVIGCLAQQEADRFSRDFPTVDFVVGTHNLHRIPELIDGCLEAPKAFCATDELHFLEPGVDRDLPFLASLTVIHGCDNYCSYCIVPYVRGRERSKPSRQIVGEVKALAGRGVVEVLLLGQNVNSYGRTPADVTFAELLGLVDGIGGIRRIRFLTSHPKDFSDELVDAVAGLAKVCRYVHLPLQSGSDRILAAMNRGYGMEQYLRIVRRIREKCGGDGEVSLTTDILTGFPGETEEDFQSTLDALRTIRFDDAYMFKYSHRKGTAAGTLAESLSEGEKTARLNEVIRVQRGISRERSLKCLGRSCEVLVEGPSRRDPAELTARTGTNRVVIVPSAGRRPGEFHTVTVKELRGSTLFAE